MGRRLCVWENASSEDGNPQKHASGGQGRTVTVAIAHGMWGQRRLSQPIKKHRQNMTVTEAMWQEYMANGSGALRCPCEGPTRWGASHTGMGTVTVTPSRR